MAHKVNDNGTIYEIGGGKYNDNGTVYEIDHGKYNDNGTVYEVAFGPGIITFTYTWYSTLIGTFEAEEGMTWGEFINSSYNVGKKFGLSSDIVTYYNPTFDASYMVSYNMVAVRRNEVIVAGRAYRTG